MFKTKEKIEQPVLRSVTLREEWMAALAKEREFEVWLRDLKAKRARLSDHILDDPIAAVEQMIPI